MSDITVGPIQTYTGDSTLSSSVVDQSPTQESVSVTLTDSNLWLVDTSKLNGQTSDSQTQYTLLDLQTGNQTTVPFENVNFTAETIATPSLTSSESSYLQTDLSQNALMLAEVTGGTQLSSSGISLSSGGSSDTGTSSGGTSGSLSDGGSGSGGGSGGSGGGGSSGSSGGSTTDSSSAGTVPGTSPSTPSSGSSSTGTAQTASSPQPLISPPLTTSPSPPVPVPFEVSPTGGLLCVLVIVGCRLLLRRINVGSPV